MLKTVLHFLSENRLLKKINKYVLFIILVLMVYILLVSVTSVGDGFKMAIGGQKEAERLFAFANTPIAGLMIGIIATVLVQSSSTITAIIVGLVAGGLSVNTAIPMVMGANIGTTITNTLVSLGYATKKKEFRRAFSAATTHDFFNILSVAIFLPLELLFGFLEYFSGLFAALLNSVDWGFSGSGIFKTAIKLPVKYIKNIMSVASEPTQGIVLGMIGVGLLFISIVSIGRILKKIIAKKNNPFLRYTQKSRPLTGIAVGTLVTSLTQSSSTTTSMVIPLVGSGLISIRSVYPFMLGANIGTTFTGILTASIIVGPTAMVAMQIALVHLLYNLCAITLFYSVKPLRYLPIFCAQWLGKVATKNRFLVIIYVAGVFFFLPGILLLLTS